MYVFSKDAILGSVPSISSEVLASVQCTVLQFSKEINFGLYKCKEIYLGFQLTIIFIIQVENCVILSEFEQNQDLMKDSGEFGVSAQGQRRLRDPHTKKWFPVKVIYFKMISFFCHVQKICNIGLVASISIHF